MNSNSSNLNLLSKLGDTNHVTQINYIKVVYCCGVDGAGPANIQGISPVWSPN